MKLSPLISTASAIILSHAATCLAAPAADVMLRMDSAAVEQLTRPAEAFSGNPAAMSRFRSFTLSQFGATGSLERRDEAAVVQQGTGHTLGNIGATSFMPLSQSTKVWGSAHFTTGNYRNIRWNNSADYRLVAPYVFGDSVGGDLSTRQYAFSGGYAGTAGRWSWGAEASYRAEIDYRNRDPRDKIIVSDLSVSVGGAYTLPRHLIGVGGTLRVYNQESDVDFYNPNNDIRAYALTGLGNFYQRFSGLSNLNAAYTGIGGRATVQLIPLGANGLSVNASMGYLRMKQLLRDFNNLTLTVNHNYNFNLFVSYSFNAGNLLMAPAVNASFVRKLGVENIFGSSVGNNYETIGSRRNYLSDDLTATASVPMQLPIGDKLRLAVTPEVGYRYSNEDYRKPNRTLRATTVIPALRAGLTIAPAQSTRIGVEAFGARTFASAEKENLQGLNLKSDLAQTVLHNFDLLTSDATTVGGSLSWTRALDSSIALRIKATAASTRYSGHGNAIAANLSLNLIF